MILAGNYPKISNEVRRYESSTSNPEQTAEALNVSYARAAQLAPEGILPAVRLGRQIRVAPDALAEFITRGGHALPGGWKSDPGGDSAAA